MNTQYNGQQFNLASSEVQGPKSPLVSGGGSKFAIIAVVFVSMIVIGIGGYYFYIKDNNSDILIDAEVTLSPMSVELLAEFPAIDKSLDTDSDGLSDYLEKVLGTYVNNSDSDGDTFSDLNEIKNGYSPLIAGGEGKYTEEEWDNMKAKIKIEDGEFFKRELEAPVAPSQSLSPTSEMFLTPSPTVPPSSM